VRPQHVADRSQRTVELHRMWICGQSLRHLGAVLVRAGGQRRAPRCRRQDLAVVVLDERLHHRADVAGQRCGDRLVAVELGRLDVDLDELGIGIPLRRVAVAEQPIEPGTDEHDDVGFAQSQRTRRGDRLRMIVGDQALGHRHR